MGVERGGRRAKDPWVLKFDIFLLNFIKKGRFLSFEKEKLNFTTFGSRGNTFMSKSGKIY